MPRESIVAEIGERVERDARAACNARLAVVAGVEIRRATRPGRHR